MKQSFKTCMMSVVGGCIDPCDDCPNMLAVKFRPCEPDQKILDYQKNTLSPKQLDELREMLRTEPIPETLCPHEQGDKNCYKTVCPSCEWFRPKGTKEENMAFCKKYTSQFEPK